MNIKKSEHKKLKVHWVFWLGLSFFIIVVIVMLAGSWLITEKVIAEEGTPVTSLVITGEMPFTVREDILMVVESIDLSNFFQVDVNDVQHQISQLPWIYSVSVRKKWPNELKIYVVDQLPVAQWNGDFLINNEGKAFQADLSRIKSKLPQFYGPEGTEVLALENFTNLNRLLEYSELSIDELVLSERFAWQLTLSDGVLLNLGREDRVKRIQRFMDVYPIIKKKKEDNQQVNYIDLRYDTGIAVGWKTIEAKLRA
jgi:cell division protein FtsQ|tara:strand:+ start:14120 stop:14884 length:765 start_codon:yes stop_codon:yes gene_type:complete